MKIARSFNCGFEGQKSTSPGGAAEFPAMIFSAAPAGLDSLDDIYTQLKLRAIPGCPFGTEPVAAPSPNMRRTPHPAVESAEGLLTAAKRGNDIRLQLRTLFSISGCAIKRSSVINR
ncbi:MAG TPA: hypothetical protein VF430_09595, partial [Verrucomicrobiae bacterium]